MFVVVFSVSLWGNDDELCSNLFYLFGGLLYTYSHRTGFLAMGCLWLPTNHQWEHGFVRELWDKFQITGWIMICPYRCSFWIILAEFPSFRHTHPWKIGIASLTSDDFWRSTDSSPFRAADLVETWCPWMCICASMISSGRPHIYHRPHNRIIIITIVNSYTTGVYLSIYLFIHLSIHPSIYYLSLFIYLNICTYICVQPAKII